MSERIVRNPDLQVTLIKRLKNAKNEALGLIAAFQESDPDFAQELRDRWQSPQEPDMEVVERIRNEELGNA